MGSPATERTEVAVLFDRDALYVGFRGYDSDPGGIRATQMACDYAFTPNLFGAVAGQWNSEDDEFIVNFRLNWIPEPGSDLFLVINQVADSEDAWWSPRRTTVLSKLAWRIAL